MNAAKPSRLQQILTAIAFIGGMTIMAVEMAAFRLMAPYFGSSVFVWTNLLGVIMLALSIGYWLGGRLADRFPYPLQLCRLLVVSALLLFTIPYLGPPLMQLASGGVQEGEVSLVVFSFLASLAIFVIPFILLGMISPTIIRLQTDLVETSGQTAGRVFAASTVGSIVGTFLPTLIFVPWIGTKRTILLFATILLLTGLIALAIWGKGKKRLALWGLLPLFLLATFTIGTQYYADADIVHQSESGYTYLRVVKDRHYGNILLQDEGIGLHSFYHPERIITGSYWDYVGILPFMQPDKREQRAVIIGSAGGSAFRTWQHVAGDDFDFTFEGAELDPKVVELADQFFAMTEIDAAIKAQDGRIYLRQHPGEIDVLLIDAYHQLYVPPHLTSLEFFELTAERLSQNGVVMLNLNALYEESDVYRRVLHTMQTAFAKVWVTKGGGPYNYLIVGTNGGGDYLSAINRVPEEFAVLKYEALTSTTLPGKLADVRLITDDLPLTEVLFDRMVGQWLWGMR